MIELIERLPFLQFLSSCYEGGSRWALISKEGDILSMRFSLASDISSLSRCVIEIQKHMPVKNGDVFVTNQNQLTQSHAMDFAMVQCLKLQDSLYYLVELIALEPFTSFSATTKEKEFMQVPPIQILKGSEDQTEILEQMNSVFGEEFSTTMRQSLHRHLTARIRIEEHSEFFPHLWKKPFLRSCFQLSHKTALHLLEEIRLGENSVMLVIEDLGTLSLKLEKEDDHFIADFSKSEISPRYQMFESDFRDALVQTLHILSGFELFLNEGIFSLFQVKSPRLHGTSQKGNRALAQFQVVPVICEAFYYTLRKLHLEDLGASNALASFMLEYSSPTSKSSALKQIFLGGGGATSLGHGEMGRCPWLKDYSMTSIEGLENQHQLVFESVGPLASSGGRGQRSGGEGIQWSIRALKQSRIDYFSLQIKNRAEGLDKGKQGLAAKVSLTQSDGTIKEFLETESTVELNEQDIFQFTTGGGGGFGMHSSDKDSSN